MIQQAIAQVLTPIFDPGFSNNSFGFRPHRNGQQAVKQVHRIIQKGHRIAVDVDLSKFFDRVNHDLLMTLLSRKVKDKRLMQLIGRYLRAGVKDGQRVQESREGVPQGGPLSPLLSNIMLAPPGQRAGTQRLPVCPIRRVRQLTNRNWGVSMKYRLFKVSQYIRGWIHYFGIANGYQRCVDLDNWIRRRVRMAYWRQWRKPCTKVRNLMKRGVHVQAAVACGLTSKGSWRSAKTPGINPLSNAYLKSQGLYALRDGWIKLHHG